MIFDNTVITGGGGFIGRAILSQAKDRWPMTTWTVYGRDPMKLESVRERFGVSTIIGDVLDTDTLNIAFAGRSMVIHAAAMKHIPQGEEQPAACLAINVFGSQNVISAAIQQGVPDLVLISTDKAAEPVNAYGLSKAMMERLAQEAALRQGRTKIHIVRYGNVVGSTGSVIPLFQRQLAQGQPLTITDPEMTRFWLSASMAIDAIESATKGPSGTIYVPKLAAMKMGDLASVIAPDTDCRMIGIRPGEKMHECLMSELEGTRAIDAGDHYRIYPAKFIQTGSKLKPFTSDKALWIYGEKMAEWIAEGATV